MYAAYVHAVGRHRPAELRDVVRIDEHDGRLDGRHAVIEPVVTNRGRSHIPVILVNRANVHGYAAQPPVESVVHRGVLGQHMRLVARVSHATEHARFDPG